MFNFSSTLFIYKFLFFFELIFAEALITYTLNKKPKFGLRVILSVFILYMLAFFFPVLGYNWWYSSFMFLFFFGATVVALKACYDESWINVLFCAIEAYTAQHIAYELNNLVNIVFDLKVINVYLPNELMSPTDGITLLNVSVYLSIIAIVYWFIWAFIAVRIRRQSELVFVNFYLFFWVAITIIIDVVFSAVVTYKANTSSDTVLIMLYLFNIFSCFLSLGYQCLMLEKDNTRRELETIQMLWKKDKERYELSKENMDLLNIRCHDLKNQISTLRTIGGMVDDDTIIELENAISFYGVNIRTGNDALDIILAEKHILCDKKKIRLNCMIDGQSLNFVSPAQLYSLFGNALQNAIESAEKIEDEEKRVILANVKSQGGMVYIQIENSCPENMELKLVDGFPVTTKAKRQEHGFGLRSIKLLCESLGGDSTFMMENNRFYMDMMIPIPTGKKGKKEYE